MFNLCTKKAMTLRLKREEDEIMVTATILNKYDIILWNNEIITQGVTDKTVTAENG